MSKFRQLKAVAGSLEDVRCDMESLKCTLELIIDAMNAQRNPMAEYVSDSLSPVVHLVFRDCIRVMEDVEEIQRSVNDYAEEYRSVEGVPSAASCPPVAS